MRIVSPWHDYYDAARKHGPGEGALFLRTTSEVTRQNDAGGAYATYSFLLENMPRETEFCLAGGGNIYLHPFRLAFCGVVFNGVRFQLVPTVGEDVVKHIYTRADLIALFAGHKLEKQHRPLHIDPHDARKTTLPWSGKLDAFMDAPPDVSRKDFFSVNGDALLLAKVASWRGDGVLTRNPVLKNLEFYRVRDVSQVYQELEMFWDGRAAPENKPPVVIEDKYRIAQHGFDKHSFRKSPTKSR